MKELTGIVIIILALSACGAAPERQDDRSETTERYMAYAGAPIDSFGFNRISGWRAISRDQLVVWTRGSAYMLTVTQPCLNLDYAHSIALTQSGTWVRSGVDHVLFDDQRCRIIEIREVDDRRMRANLQEQGG